MDKTSSQNAGTIPPQGMSAAARPDRVGERAATISGETIGQLIRMKNDFADLRKLREREHASSQILIGALKDALLELDTTIPLNKESLSLSFPHAREIWLSPDSSVTVIDSSGTKNSIPLESLPSPVIALALQDCAVKMNELMSQKLDRAAQNVDLLERAVWELQNAGKPFEQEPPAQVQQEQGEKGKPQKVDEKSGLSLSDRLMGKKPAKGDNDRFAYSGEFKGKQGAPMVGTLPETKGNHASSSS